MENLPPNDEDKDQILEFPEEEKQSPIQHQPPSRPATKKKFRVKQVEKYVITEQLGEGTNGMTFKCYHEDNPHILYCAKKVSREIE